MGPAAILGLGLLPVGLPLVTVHEGAQAGHAGHHGVCGALWSPQLCGDCAVAALAVRTDLAIVGLLADAADVGGVDGAAGSTLAGECDSPNDCDSGFEPVYRGGKTAVRTFFSKNGPVLVFGTGQATGDATHKDERNLHAAQMEDITAKLAATGDYEFLTMDLSIRTTTGRIIGSGDRPDIIGVRCDGQLDVWEVQSSGQSRNELKAKGDRMKTVIGERLNGEVEIIEAGVFHVH